MPNTREKLIELLESDNCPLLYVLGENIGTLADYLIANGVTVQKWIPVSERLPDNDIRVLVYLDREVYKHTHVDTDRRHNDYWVRWRNYVTHWMPLPTPPKETTP